MSNERLSALLVLDRPKGLKYISQALRDNEGNVAFAAEDLGVNRKTIYKWFRKYPELKVAWDRICYESRERRKGELSA